MLFHCFGMLKVRENDISLRNSSGGPEHLRTLEGTLLTMQCKWTFTKRSFLHYKENSPCYSNSHKNASFAAVARYISITTIYTKDREPIYHRQQNCGISLAGRKSSLFCREPLPLSSKGMWGEKTMSRSERDFLTCCLLVIEFRFDAMLCFSLG